MLPPPGPRARRYARPDHGRATVRTASRLPVHRTAGWVLQDVPTYHVCTLAALSDALHGDRAHHRTRLPSPVLRRL